jgi:general L-amino acid transport system permease protein
MGLRSISSSVTRWLRDSTVIGWVLQIGTLALVLGLFAVLASEAMSNYQRTGSYFEWDWMSHKFLTQLSEGYDTHPVTAGDALRVGIVNTLRVTIAAIIGGTIIGVAVGIGRLSENWIVRAATTMYVETFRNIPVLLQMFFWEALIISLPPIVSDGIGEYVFIASNKGLGFAWIRASWGLWLWTTVLLIAIVIVRRRGGFERSRASRVWWVFGGLTLAVLGWLALDSVAGPLLKFEMASIVQRGNFPQFGTTGAVMTESFFAVWFGLTIYIAAFIGEIVRGGILAVERGQREAGQALGLTRLAVLRFIVLPQAMRVILPPLGNQYLNVLKYSALGVAVAYPEILKVGFSIINQTGQFRAVLLVWIAFFLSFSLAISAVINYYNRKVGLVGERIHALESR